MLPVSSPRLVPRTAGKLPAGQPHGPPATVGRLGVGAASAGQGRPNFPEGAGWGRLGRLLTAQRWAGGVWGARPPDESEEQERVRTPHGWRAEPALRVLLPPP